MKKILTTIKNFFLRIFKKKSEPFTVGAYHMGIGKMQIGPPHTKKEEKRILKSMTKKEIDEYFEWQAKRNH